MKALERTPFDVLVIGGGIAGAATARDAASRGLAVALLEREDWASGTSWRSSKLIHGGLRYLQTGDIGLVFESLAERARLLRLAPHLVEPLEFLFASFRDRWVSPLSMEIGLSLYDFLALGRSPRRHQRLSKRDLLRIEVLLESPDLLGGALYADARTDDARLTLENVLDAVSLGAVAVSQVEVAELVKNVSGHIEGVLGRDRESGRSFAVRSRVVINATGPWADLVRRRDEADAPPELRLSKGVHVTVPAARLPVERAVAFPVPDGRLLFAIPYGSVTLLGTTDSDYSGSLDDVFAAPADVEYLLRQAEETFPRARLTKSDIVATFAGLRPLHREPGKRIEKTSREDAVTVSSAGLVTVTGGKLTTHRRMAEKAIDRTAPLLRGQGLSVPASSTKRRPFPGAPQEPLAVFIDGFARAAADLGLDGQVARHLAMRYGKQAERVLALLSRERGLGERLDPGLPDIVAEVVFAAKNEDARTLADVLIRRTHLFWQAPRQGADALDRVTELLSRELQWTKAQEREERESYLRLVARSRKSFES